MTPADETPANVDSAPPAEERSVYGGHAWFSVWLTFGLLFVAVGVAYVGTRGAAPSEFAQRIAPVPIDPAAEVVTMELPHVEPEIPEGPNRRTFQTSCITCHSTRLVFTQPGLAADKWTPVVHKMVAVYGAPISTAEEKEIVDYLAAVHGPQLDSKNKLR